MHNWTGEGSGDAVNRLHARHHQPAELVEVARLGAGDHVVGTGHVLGLLYSLDLGNVPDYLGSLADFGLDEDVCPHHRYRLPNPAVIEGLHTDRYWQIWTPGTHWGKLIDAEIDAQVIRLNALVSILRGYLPLRERPGHLAVLDTNVLLHYQPIDQVDWGKVIKDSPVRLVVPHIVLDELDNKRYLGSDKIRERARSAIVPSDARREQLEGQGYAKLPVGDATVEYLVDEEGHTRCDNPDEEIVDRARFLQQMTGRKVTLITADRGMRARAIARGLQVAGMSDALARDQKGA